MIPVVSGDGGVMEISDCMEPGSYCETTNVFGLGGFLSYGRGAAFGDIDGDGWQDLFVVDCDYSGRSSLWGRSKMYRNLEGRGFAATDIGLHTDHLDGGWNGSFADYDNDGDPDLLITAGGYSTMSKLSLYENRMDTEARFVDATPNLGLSVADQGDFHWWNGSWSDYDGDGFLDVVVTRRYELPLLFHNLGDGRFEEVGLTVGIDSPTATNGADAKNPIWIDHDADGDPDLYIAGINADAFYRNDGVAGFTRISSPVESLGIWPTVFATAVADFDQDGIDDIYFGRWFEQDVVGFGRGDGTFDLRGPEIGLDAVLGYHDESSPLPYENTMGLTVIDLFDDGYPDIYIGTGEPRVAAADILYCNDGTGSFDRCTETLFRPEDGHLITRGHAMVSADVDHDGDSDIFLNLGGHPTYDLNAPGTDSRELNRFFLQDSGREASTVVLELSGTVSNRDAVGARVTATGERTSYHSIRSSQGFQNQRSPELFLPTGDAQTVTIVVDWPSGARSEATSERGSRLRMVEPQP